MTNDAMLTKLEEKARKKASKAGVPVGGALMVAHDLNEDTQWVTLVVWPDRVEAHNHGKVGTFTRKGAGVESMPITKVSSVQAVSSMLYSKLQVHGSGNSVEFRTSKPQAEALRALISNLMRGEAAPSPSSPIAPASATTTDGDVIAQLRQLGELHQAGVLTDDEFTTKKAELLARI